MDTKRRFDELTYEDYPPPGKLFAVVSWGAAATRWLAATLNDCPGIFCAHSSNEFWTQFAGARVLDGLSYLRLVGMMGSGARAAGDVHGISRYDIPAIREAFGERFRAVVMVRAPVPRLKSQLGLFARYAAVSSWSIDYLKEKFPDVRDLLPTGAYEDWLFVHGVNMFNNILDEGNVGPIIRMEDVTTNPQALIDLVDYLTGGSVSAPRSWADEAVSSGALNRHASGEALILAPWQRKVFVRVVDQRAIELHRELGYGFDELTL